jgi:hypothetical protein
MIAVLPIGACEGIATLRTPLLAGLLAMVSPKIVIAEGAIIRVAKAAAALLGLGVTVPPFELATVSGASYQTPRPGH